MKKCIGLAAICIAVPAIAQEAVAPPTSNAVAVQPIAVLEPVSQVSILRSGTEVPLVMREELTTKKKKLRVGQRFQMEVAQNIEMNGVTVIPAGSPAIGEITEVRNKGMWGKSGYIGARAVSVRVGDRTIRLTGNFDDKGVTGTGGVVASIALLWPAGFVTTGTSALIASGAGVKAFLDEDIAFRSVPVQPKVMDIPVAAPAAPSAPALTPEVVPAAAGN